MKLTPYKALLVVILTTAFWPRLARALDIGNGYVIPFTPHKALYEHIEFDGRLRGSDKTYTHWVVYVTSYIVLEQENHEAWAKAQKEAKRFPVSKDGTFHFALENMPSGFYVLYYGSKEEEAECTADWSTCSTMRFTLDTDKKHFGDVWEVGE